MNKLLYLFLATVSLFGCQSAKHLSSKDDVKKYQTELAQSYTNPDTTPLVDEERINFHGITFFPINEKYTVKAKFTPIQDGKVIPFPTSSKKIKHYKEYGTVEFIVDGQSQKLTVYQSSPIMEKYKDSLFLPFMDETNGVTSYGGGRYLDLSTNDLGNKSTTIILDFNKAYNPYCAYSKHYNCPIPPANNVLDIEINAGVSYHK
ncbi:DUF1684 domain-containing protein [Chishuiella sp.]|uniref:DUF1684 domain-containing protein n=1 Tax=Chishuiella sp. TaxID=1969467 RepID=UPI0028AD5A44|nr:DUF1684 domain-containing protein [Chishuiella sp.]